MASLQKIIQWLFALFVIYVIIEVIRKIFRGSLGFEELVTTLLVVNLGYSFSLNHRVSALNSKISEHLGWHKGKDNSRH
mgnify:CR=1 FL=1